MHRALVGLAVRPLVAVHKTSIRDLLASAVRRTNRWTLLSADPRTGELAPIRRSWR
jgi:hypothetical protein